MTTPAELKHLLDVPLHFEALLPGPALRVGELLALSEGSLIKTGRQAGETVEVFAGGSLIGSLPHRGTALTAHKTSMAHHVSIPLASWHAHACTAVVCLQAVQAPSIQHPPRPGRSRFCSPSPRPMLHRSSFAPAMLPISGPATLKIHR